MSDADMDASVASEPRTPTPPADLAICISADEALALRREIAALNARLAERNARWLALYQIAVLFTQQVYSGDILTQIVRQSMNLLQAHDAGLLELDPVAGDLVARVALAREGPPPLRVGLRVPAGVGLTGLALQTGQIQIVDAYHAWPHRVAEVRSGSIYAALAAPLVGRRGIIGVLGLAFETPERRITEDDLQMVTLLAQQAAAVLDAAAARRLEHELLMRNERRRLAQELHDGTQQRLAALLLRIDACQAALAEMRPEPRACALLEEVATEVQNLIRDTRGTVHALYDWELRDRSLDDALRSLVEQRAAETGLQIRVDLPPYLSGLLSPQGRAVVLRFVREALMNTYKHAQASEATVRLERLEGAYVRLSVRDNGRGATPEAVWGAGREAGFGLLSLREQVEALGGRCGFDAAPGRGATVWAEIPIAGVAYAYSHIDR